MKIEPTMDLGALAERMGADASIEDARHMRDELLSTHWQDTADIPGPVWLALLECAAKRGLT